MYNKNINPADLNRGGRRSQKDFVINRGFMSDAGQGVHKILINKGIIPNSDNCFGYFTSYDALDKSILPLSQVSYTGDIHPQLTKGAQQNIEVGAKLAQISIEQGKYGTILDNCTGDMMHLVGMLGGGSTTHAIKKAVEYKNNVNKRDDNRELTLLEELVMTKYPIIATLGVPSIMNRSVYNNALLGLDVILKTNGVYNPIAGYKLVKIDDIRARIGAEPTRDQVCEYLAIDQEMTNQVVYRMVTSQGESNLDVGEINETLVSGGEIVASEGVGQDMKEAYNNLLRSVTKFNAQATINTAKWILVQFDYPEGYEYTANDTQSESFVIESLNSKLRDGGHLKDAVIKNVAGITTPRLTVLATGIDPEEIRARNSAIETDTEIRSTFNDLAESAKYTSDTRPYTHAERGRLGGLRKAMNNQ